MNTRKIKLLELKKIFEVFKDEKDYDKANKLSMEIRVKLKDVKLTPQKESHSSYDELFVSYFSTFQMEKNPNSLVFTIYHDICCHLEKLVS